MSTLNNKTVRAVGPAILAVTGVFGFALALNVAVRLVHNTPRVGDIVSFRPSPAPPIDDGVRLIVHRPDQFGCVLDLNVLRHWGGSLILETQPGASSGTFRAHWAGTRTSDDPANCGPEADLIVDRLDLDILSLAAGGYGAGGNRRAAFSLASVD